MILPVKKLVPEAKLPTRSYNSAGYDLYALKGEILHPFECDIEFEDIAGSLIGEYQNSPNVVKVRTAIAMEIPDGHVGLIRDRSSIGSKGVIVSAGVIDADYRGEIIVCMINLNPDKIYISAGEKIAQMIIMPVFSGSVHEVEMLAPTRRGGQGFGSTGVT